ncbi:hypothetical protein B5F77_08685 [Parabacteroides sp. An277]|uniref:hypothetical protein n=1 Tax=Parabacteroides sp. An277 TaxID=1965619 RepID=UPI000B38861D|nr:hypothetical protein [Parabacteroides sp. An277]OUO52414.1 hypothetical protein B5F77_08685 [Parabacteroides sp. An277]
MKITDKYAEKRYIVSADQRKIVSLKDKGESRKYIADNSNRLFLTVYRVDNGLFDSSQVGNRKCDYAIYTDTDTLYLIELKGGDYASSLEQLANTVRQMLTPEVQKPCCVYARVVLSKTKVPAFLETKEKMLKSLLKKQYNGNLQKATREMKEIMQ